MKKVCLFHVPQMGDFHGYSIDSLDPFPYFGGHTSWWKRKLLFRKLTEAKSIDRMYRDRDPAYMRFLHDFVAKFQDADLVVLSTYNPVHPEVLFNDLRKPIKILGFIDDPVSTYTRGIPYLWAFDGAFYVSPSYNEKFLFKDALSSWGCEQSCWWPLVPPDIWATTAKERWPLAVPRLKALQQGDTFFRHRNLDLIYVGGAYGPKLDRLVQLRKRFGSRMNIYGRWPLRGYSGAARLLWGKSPLWTRVRPLSNEQRAELYYRAKIGIDMHFSENAMETGNMRMYEIPAHGMMLLCDKAGMNAHEQIFEPGKEAVFYDSIEDAMDKAAYYLRHDDEREKIARAGFARAHRDYDGESNMKKFLDWASSLSRKPIPSVHL
jgi:hypothetical protein